MDERTRTLTANGDSLFAKKRPWDTLCQEIANNFYPLRSDFTTNFTLGDSFAIDVMDGYAVQARETLGNSIDAMLRQGDWYKVGTGDTDRDQRDENAQALAYATRKLNGIVTDKRSNWSIMVKDCDHDWVAFGSPVASVEASADRRYIQFKSWHPKTCAWALNEAGAVDTNHRKMMMQCRHIKKRLESKSWNGTMSNAIRMACEKEPHREFEVRHILMPIDEVYGSDPAMLRKFRHGFLSLYLDVEGEEILHEAGAPMFNYVMPRWRALSGFAQGFSPAAINSLPDGRMLQSLARLILEQGEKAIDPPMVGSGSIFTRDINLYAGGFTSVDLPEGDQLQHHMTTIDTGQGLPLGLQLKQDVRNLLAEAWLLNKLFLPSAREMTAYESSVRTEEFRRAALPFFTPIQSEYHSPILGTAFDLGIHMKIIDVTQFPPDLHGQDISFQYVSPLEAAEGQAVVDAFQKSITIIASGATVDNQIGNVFDPRKMTIDAVRGAGGKPDWIKSDKEQAAITAADKQKKAMQEQAQALREGAAVAQDLSSAKAATQAAGLLPQNPGGSGTVPQAA